MAILPAGRSVGLLLRGGKCGPVVLDKIAAVVRRVFASLVAIVAGLVDRVVLTTVVIIAVVVTVVGENVVIAGLSRIHTVACDSLDGVRAVETAVGARRMSGIVVVVRVGVDYCLGEAVFVLESLLIGPVAVRMFHKEDVAGVGMPDGKRLARKWERFMFLSINMPFSVDGGIGSRRHESGVLCLREVQNVLVAGVVLVLKAVLVNRLFGGRVGGYLLLLIILDLRRWVGVSVRVRVQRDAGPSVGADFRACHVPAGLDVTLGRGWRVLLSMLVRHTGPKLSNVRCRRPEEWRQGR